MEGPDTQPANPSAQPRQIINGYQPDSGAAVNAPAPDAGQAIPVKVNVQSSTAASAPAPFMTANPTASPTPPPAPTVPLTPFVQQPVAPTAVPVMDVQPPAPMPGSLQADQPQPDLQAKINNHPLFSGASEPAPKRPRRGSRRLAWAAGIIIILLAIGYILIDAGIVRGASHLPFHIFKQSTATTAPVITPQPTTVDQYAGWKTYTLKNEKLSFKYPADWTLADNSASKTNLNSNETEKGDSLVLSKGDSFKLSIEAGAYPSVDAATNTTFPADYLTFTGQPAKMAFYDELNSLKQVALAVLNTAAGQTFNTKNVAIPAGGQSSKGNIDISIGFGDSINGQPATQALAALLADANYKNAKLIIQSMSY